jgi:hypothetical protein
VSETGRKRKERFERRNRLVSAKKRARQFINTSFGNKLTGDFVERLAAFFAGEHDKKPDDPPRFLRKRVRELNDPHFLALAALAPLLDGIFRGWGHDDDDDDDDDGTSSAEAKLKLKAGAELCRRLRRIDPEHKRFSEKQRLHAGNWLVTQALKLLDIFDHDDDGLPCLSDKGRRHAKKLRERMIATDPSFMPLPKPPPPWDGLEKTYDDGFTAKFVRDWRPETERAIEAAFLSPDFEHARAVNALAQVPLMIDPVMLDLVKRCRQLDADELTVAADVADAKLCGDRVFWLDYNCDNRGRIYPLSYLSFAREDYVKSLFRFAHGLPINGDTRWLEIHCANCAGKDKESIEDRLKWVVENREIIKQIAADPFGTRDQWQDADAPYQYVAACRELAAAWADPQNFQTALPIGLDGSANGLQHLSLLVRSLPTAAAVNLCGTGDDGEHPSDVYGIVIDKAIELIKLDQSAHAAWWRERLASLSKADRRKLLKTPICAFGYSVTPRGAAKRIAKTYKSLLRRAQPSEETSRLLPAFRRGVAGRRSLVQLPSGNVLGKSFKGRIVDTEVHPREVHLRFLRQPTQRDRRVIEERGVFLYLAKIVLQACETELPRPAEVMRYMRDVAEHCTDRGRFPEWESPSGFPVSNRYNVPKESFVECKSGKVKVKHKIADGVTDKIRVGKVLSAVSANITHALDAAHAVKVVNRAVSEGITNIVTLHDCYFCAAPQVSRLQDIILEEMANMYGKHCPLSELHARNVGDPNMLPVPEMGDTLVFEHDGWMLRYVGRTKTTYKFELLERVKKSKYAFT